MDNPINLGISDTDFRVTMQAREEDLDLEFKRTLNLSDSAGKSKLAKEICALANYGGGWIVFGREDNGEIVDELPEELHGINQDTVNQISASYLTPAPHCTLRWVKDEDKGINIPIIWVPSHGTEPVCAARNGPDNKGKITGVKMGTYYIRSAGPVSEAMTSPAQWKDVIRRCVLNDKTQLLGALSAMISQPTLSVDTEESALDAELEFITNEWLSAMDGVDEDPDPKKNFIIFGFEFIGLHELSIEQINKALRSLPSRSLGPHHFFQAGYHGNNAPYVIHNSQGDGLQANITKIDDDRYDEWPSLWRISEVGTAVSVGIYWEDSTWLKEAVEGKSSRTWDRGSNIWLASQMASIDSFLSDIWSLSRSVGFQGKVRIRIVYNGLKDRTLNSPRSSMSYSGTYVSKQDKRTVDLTLQIEALEETVRSSITTRIIQQLNKPFQGPAIDNKMVVQNLDGYRRG